MGKYSIFVNLHIRHHVFPVYVILETTKRRREMHKGEEEEILKFLNRLRRHYWHECNIKELEHLSYNNMRVYARIGDIFWYLFKTGDPDYVKKFMDHDMNKDYFFKDYFKMSEKEKYLGGLL